MLPYCQSNQDLEQTAMKLKPQCVSGTSLASHCCSFRLHFISAGCWPVKWNKERKNNFWLWMLHLFMNGHIGESNWSIIYPCHWVIVFVLFIINSSSPAQNGRCLADDIFRCVFMNEKFCIFQMTILRCIFFHENVCIFNTIWAEFIPKGLVDNNYTPLVQIMAWCRIGDKPLSEPIIADVGWCLEKLTDI